MSTEIWLKSADNTIFNQVSWLHTKYIKKVIYYNLLIFQYYIVWNPQSNVNCLITVYLLLLDNYFTSYKRFQYHGNVSSYRWTRINLFTNDKWRDGYTNRQTALYQVSGIYTLWCRAIFLQPIRYISADILYPRICKLDFVKSWWKALIQHDLQFIISRLMLKSTKKLLVHHEYYIHLRSESKFRFDNIHSLCSHTCSQTPKILISRSPSLILCQQPLEYRILLRLRKHFMTLGLSMVFNVA